MEYNKSIGGAWVNADSIIDGQKVKLVSECTKQESRFKDKEGNPKVENVAKVRIEGDEESKNLRLNWTSIAGLIDAYGRESKDWINKPLTFKTLDAMVGETMRTIVYLIPEGFELAKNAESKMIIQKIGVNVDEGEVSDSEVPF